MQGALIVTGVIRLSRIWFQYSIDGDITLIGASDDVSESDETTFLPKMLISIQYFLRLSAFGILILLNEILSVTTHP